MMERRLLLQKEVKRSNTRRRGFERLEVKRKDLEQNDARLDNLDEEMFEGLLRTPQVGLKRSTFCAYHKGVTPVPRLQG